MQQSIKDNPAYMELLSRAEELAQAVNDSPPMEVADKFAFDTLNTAYSLALDAMTAMIDAHSALQSHHSVQQHRRTTVSVSMLAGLYQNEAFQQSLTDYRIARNALAEADKVRVSKEVMTALDAACETAEQGVIATVQAFAAQVNAPDAKRR